MSKKITLIPFAIFLIITPFSNFLDHFFSSLFYNPKRSAFINPTICKFFYLWGEILGIALAFCALIFFLISFKKKIFKRYQPHLLAFICTVLFGAGLITNLMLKEFWGRPRPNQTQEYNGTFAYRTYYQPHLFAKESLKSFPSGHAAIGLCPLSLVFSFRREKKKTAVAIATAVTIILGGGLMCSRVIQGGHFFTDVFASLVLITFLSSFFDTLFFEKKVLKLSNNPTNFHSYKYSDTQ